MPASRSVATTWRMMSTTGERRRSPFAVGWWFEHDLEVLAGWVDVDPGADLPAGVVAVAVLARRSASASPGRCAENGVTTSTSQLAPEIRARLRLEPDGNSGLSLALVEWSSSSTVWPARSKRWGRNRFHWSTSRSLSSDRPIRPSDSPTLSMTSRTMPSGLGVVEELVDHGLPGHLVGVDVVEPGGDGLVVDARGCAGVR